MNLLDNAVYLIKDIETFELSQQAQRKSKEMLEKSVVDYQNKLHTAEENLEIALSATTLLQSVFLPDRLKSSTTCLEHH